VANTLRFSRNGAVGFIGWLDGFSVNTAQQKKSCSIGQKHNQAQRNKNSALNSPVGWTPDRKVAIGDNILLER
jgi:hypothetical protein